MTDAAMDLSTVDSFLQKDCNLTSLSVVPNQAFAPCAESDDLARRPNEVSTTITIEGTFNCPSLESGISGEEIKIDSGSFYAEWSRVDACVGGGGSGGIPPTPY